LIYGTSSSTAQLSGIVASLQEYNPNLTVYWEPTVPGLMVSANENVDEYYGGVWPLSSRDFIDDKDGAGLVNAYEAGNVLQPASKRDGGQIATNIGHDYDYIDTATWPVGTWYTEIYNAWVGVGATLRAAAQIDSIPTCGTPATATNCSANPYPKFHLYICEDGVGCWTYAALLDQNYQFVSYKNTSGVAKTWRIKLYMQNWSGLGSSYLGVAWSSRP
jgi:hypothetical protein